MTDTPIEQINGHLRVYDSFSAHQDPDWCQDEFSDTVKFLLKAGVTNGFIEIGVRTGASFRLWAHYIKGVKIGIDTSPIPAEVMALPETYGIRGSSHDASTVAKVREILDGRLVDWLFIDGDHGPGVTQDYNEYKEFVRVGGYIGFHDVRHGGHKCIGELYDSITAEKQIMDCSVGIGLVRVE
jgi:hypothetical protein